MWASTYNLYDRFSPPWQKFLESLTVMHGVPGLKKLKERVEKEGGDGPGIYTGPRGAPENTDPEFSGRQVGHSSMEN